MLLSMVQQSQAFGLSLVEVLTDPRSAAKAAGELALGTYIAPRRVIPRVPKTKLQAIHSQLLADVESSGNSQLSSFFAFAQGFDLLPATIVYNFPELSEARKAKRKKQLDIISRERADRLSRALDGGLIDEYRARRIRSIDELALKASSEAGGTIGAARKAIKRRLSSA